MSWHTNAVVIKSDFSDDYEGLFEQLGLKGGEAGGAVSFDDAASLFNEGVAIGTVNGWTALFGSMVLFMIDDKGLAKISKKANVFQMILEGTSGTAGFTWWVNGKAIRNWMRQDDKLIKNEGKPLPEEKKAFAKNDDEQAVLQLLMSLTLPLKDLQGIEYKTYSFPEDVMFG
jgi:hypothetical protein